MAPINCWEIDPSGWAPVMNGVNPVRTGRDLETGSDGLGGPEVKTYL